MRPREAFCLCMENRERLKIRRDMWVPFLVDIECGTKFRQPHHL